MDIRIRQKDFERIRDYMKVVEESSTCTAIILTNPRDFERCPKRKNSKQT